MIKGDSTEYEILEEACKTLDTDDLFTAEIGVREGQGSQIILKELIEKKHWHIGIDPYGNLDYQHYDNSGSYTADYTNTMKQQLIKDLDYPNFTLYQLGDDEFMKRFEDGVPIYRDKKELKTNYDLVHFDGPHKTIDVSFHLYNHIHKIQIYHNVDNLNYHRGLYLYANVFFHLIRLILFENLFLLLRQSPQ